MQGQEIQYQLTRAGDLVSGMAMFITIDPVAIDSSVTIPSINATKYKAYKDASGVTRFLSKTFVDDLGRALINQVKMTIGNYEIETHPGDWLHLWDKLTRPAERSFVDTNPVPHGGVTKFNPADFHNFDGNLNYGVATAANTSVDPSRYQLPLGGPVDGQASTTSLDAVSTGFRWAQAPQGPNNFQQFAYPHVNRGDTPMFLYVPLIFTCCTAPAQSLPMIALQYHDVKLSVKLNPIEQVSIFQSTGGSLRVKDAPQITATGAGINMSLVATYIFLDDAERRSVALSPHQFLMTEIQTQQFAIDPNASRSSYQLYFNHPITELFIYFSKNAYRDSSSTAVVNHYWNWTFDGPQVELSNYDATEAAVGAPAFRQAFSRMNLALNQQKIYDDSRDAVWFTHYQPTKYHTRFISGSDRVAIIPFALDCETWRPTGSVNFSRIDSVMLQLEWDVPAGQHLPAGTAYVVGRNFNIVKVVGGELLHAFKSVLVPPQQLCLTCFSTWLQAWAASGLQARTLEELSCKNCEFNQNRALHWIQKGKKPLARLTTLRPQQSRATTVGALCVRPRSHEAIRSPRALVCASTLSLSPPSCCACIPKRGCQLVHQGSPLIDLGLQVLDQCKLPVQDGLGICHDIVAVSQGGLQGGSCLPAGNERFLHGVHVLFISVTHLISR